jgi:zinc protease
MFNGTSTRAQGEFDRVLEANGARNNAFTTNDVTVYQDWLPRAALPTVFEVEADRLRNLAFDAKVIESERGVVHSERRLRVDDSYIGRLQEQVQATAFLAHPYQIPTIGWPSDIQSWRIEDLKTFFATYYAPNNCTLILVGDVEPKSVIALARQYFEPIPAHAPPEPVRTQEPRQEGERRVKRRSYSSRTTRYRARTRGSLRWSCSRASSRTAMRRACTGCWSKKRNWPFRRTASSIAASIRASHGSC